MKKNLISILALAIAGTALILTLFPNEKKVAFVNTIELFNGFSLKKNMEAEYTALKEKHQFTLDSLRLSLQSLEMEIKTSGQKEIFSNDPEFIKYRTLENEYLRLSQAYQQQEEMKSSEMDQLIWTQLNQYCIDFAKQENIDVLLGANGTGSLMYGDQAMDVTKDLITFINASYEGKN